MLGTCRWHRIAVAADFATSRCELASHGSDAFKLRVFVRHVRVRQGVERHPREIWVSRKRQGKQSDVQLVQEEVHLPHAKVCGNFHTKAQSNEFTESLGGARAQ